jgi:hypothetical protein
MKKIALSILLMLISILSYSQIKPEIGIYSEGGYFFPKGSSGSQKFYNDFAAGVGAFACIDITSKVSVSLQAGYRYKSNDATSAVLHGGSSYGQGYETVKLNYKQHYFVLPVKVNCFVSEKIFVVAGLETAWLLNYDIVNEKPEFNGLFGFGYRVSPKVKVSVEYINGFKNQAMGPVLYEGMGYAQIYKNRMLMLSLSYSVFGGRE